MPLDPQLVGLRVSKPHASSADDLKIVFFCVQEVGIPFDSTARTTLMDVLLDANAQDEHKRRNLLQSITLITGMGLILALATWMMWGWVGVSGSAIVLASLVFLSPHVPPAAVMRLYRGQKIAPETDNQLNALLNVLAHRADLPSRPDLYVIPSLTINAFAVGSPDHSAVAVTEGLLRRLSMREISGVLAHEISHIRNNDLWVLGIADVITRFLQLLSYVALALALMNVIAALDGHRYVSWWLVALLYLAPMASSILQLGLSRAREFDADLEAAALTGDPTGLAGALNNLERHTGHFWEDLMFPVPSRRVPHPSLLRSHPTTKARIQRLMALSERPKLAPIIIAEEPMVSLVGFGPIELRPRYRWPGLWF